MSAKVQTEQSVSFDVTIEDVTCACKKQLVFSIGKNRHGSLWIEVDGHECEQEKT